jgi:hypothetical protein
MLTLDSLTSFIVVFVAKHVDNAIGKDWDVARLDLAWVIEFRSTLFTSSNLNKIIVLLFWILLLTIVQTGEITPSEGQKHLILHHPGSSTNKERNETLKKLSLGVLFCLNNLIDSQYQMGKVFLDNENEEQVQHILNLTLFAPILLNLKQSFPLQLDLLVFLSQAVLGDVG